MTWAWWNSAFLLPPCWCLVVPLDFNDTNLTCKTTKVETKNQRNDGILPTICQNEGENFARFPWHFRQNWMPFKINCVHTTLAMHHVFCHIVCTRCYTTSFYSHDETNLDIAQSKLWPLLSKIWKWGFQPFLGEQNGGNFELKGCSLVLPIHTI